MNTFVLFFKNFHILLRVCSDMHLKWFKSQSNLNGFKIRMAHYCSDVQLVPPAYTAGVLQDAVIECSGNTLQPGDITSHNAPLHFHPLLAPLPGYSWVCQTARGDKSAVGCQRTFEKEMLRYPPPNTFQAVLFWDLGNMIILWLGFSMNLNGLTQLRPQALPWKCYNK